MVVDTSITKYRHRNIVQGCDAVHVRVDRVLLIPGVGEAHPMQSWWIHMNLSRNRELNRKIIADGFKELRETIQQTAYLGSG